MRDQSLLYWGIVVTMFILIAGMLTVREFLDMYFEKRQGESEEESTDESSDAA